MKKPSSPFSPQKESVHDDPTPVACVDMQKRANSRQLGANSIWLSRKMLDEGCTLGQTLHVMEERCKNCEVISPMLCVGQCDTWKVKRELRETTRILADSNHGLRLLNALKNSRRLAMLRVLTTRPLAIEQLQEELKKLGYQHSQKTVNEYLQPLINAGLIEKHEKQLRLTLYGEKITNGAAKYGFSGHLPIHSSGREEAILRDLLRGPKTRDELLRVSSDKSISRTLKRLQESGLVFRSSPPDRVFYFPTKRALTIERLSPTQKRIHVAIPSAGISARALSAAAGVNMRRLYKYLRNLRGKKLVFRRNMPLGYELTARGRSVARFLDEVAQVK